MIKYLLNRWIFDKNFASLSEKRKYAGYCEGFFSISINLLMFALKFIFGLTLHSHALIADAFHSLSDCSSSLVAIIGLKASNKPPDKEHPFGHGRVEFICTLIISGFLLLVGYEILKSSFHGFFAKDSHPISMGIYFFVFLTILANEFLARISFTLSAITGSRVFDVEGHHHRSDALSSILVLLSLFLKQFGLDIIDPFIGAGLSLWIMWIAFSSAKKSISPLIGEAPCEKDLDKIVETIASIPQIYNVHDIIYHNYGNTLLLSIHIELSEKLTFVESHDICEKVEKNVSEILHATVVVHSDPVNPENPIYQILKEEISMILKNDKEILSFYGLRIIEYKNKKSEAIFNIYLREKDSQRNQEIKQNFLKKLQKKHPSIHFSIHVSPPWAYVSKRSIDEIRKDITPSS
ncbi:hypothetical protein AB834_00455 [PVC group bacterium (ex Bugula neritina AB1)]|nr:hypothetical protein AB834_00455 [PVC group bacterium (ex Bugula neritina AB1)]